MNTQATPILCAACHRMNLPGGVRCSYCGVHYPVALDFDFGKSNAPTTGIASTPISKQAGQQGKRAGLFGTLMLLLLKGKALLSLLQLGKIAFTLTSMCGFMLTYAIFFGWRFAVGLGICILIHEMGHMVVAWNKGLKVTAPMFIPFAGAVIFVKHFPDDPTVEAEVGAGGPFAGMLASLGCLLIGHITGYIFWMALANFGFLINLFNLLPFAPLDGSRVSVVFSHRIWSGVLISLLLLALKVALFPLWPILVFNFLFRIGNVDHGRELLALPKVRIRMAVLYVILCIGLSYGWQSTIYAMPDFPGTTAPSRATNSSNQPEIARHNRPRQIINPFAATTSSSPSALDTGETSPTQIADEPSAQLRYLVKGIMGLVTGGLWLLIVFLLLSAADQPFQPRHLLLPAMMLGLFLALLFGAKYLPISGHNRLMLMAAYYAASIAALFYAGHQAYHQNRKLTRPPLIALVARCLGWMWFGAMLVAYTANSWPVVVCLTVIALGVYARYPWMPIAQAAGLAENLGEHERGLALLQHAIARKPDGDSLALLWGRVARLNILQDRGDAALQALQARDAALGKHVGNLYVPQTLADLEIQASALMLTDRFDEALACCERMLQISPDDPMASLRLLTVHLRLSRIAFYRGWADEAVAQTDVCLRAAPRLSKLLLARLQAGRAEALAATGETAAALQVCQEALSAAREPYVQAWTAVTRAQVCLRTGDAKGAERETRNMMRLMPDNLQFRYWRGKTLLALGENQGTGRREGQEMLGELATRYPGDHWGRIAAAALRQTAPSVIELP